MLRICRLLDPQCKDCRQPVNEGGQHQRRIGAHHGDDDAAKPPSGKLDNLIAHADQTVGLQQALFMRHKPRNKGVPGRNGPSIEEGHHEHKCKHGNQGSAVPIQLQVYGKTNEQQKLACLRQQQQSRQLEAVNQQRGDESAQHLGAAAHQRHQRRRHQGAGPVQHQYCERHNVQHIRSVGSGLSGPQEIEGPG
ncbi:hypothetical protein D3C75_710660 [compost metagenome]